MIDGSAMRAGSPRRPDAGFQPFAGLVVIGKDRVLKDSGGHGKLSMPPFLLRPSGFVKVIIAIGYNRHWIRCPPESEVDTRWRHRTELGGGRRTRSLNERRVRHGLNANLIFKWIRRSREGWRDRRREPAKDKPVVVAPPERDRPAFVPVKLLELDAASAPSPSDIIAKPARQTRRGARRGAMEISLPNGAKVSLDAEVDAEALHRVLSALGVA